MLRPARRFGVLLLLCAAVGRAQAPVPSEPPAPTDTTAVPPLRPPEGSVIITLPSADTNPIGSLQFLINHRFTAAVQDSDIHSFFSFFSPAKVGLGLSYAPLRGLETGFLRAPDMEDYEVFAKYSFFAPADGPFHAAVRLGGDFRTEKNPLDDHRSSFFAQATLAFTIASRVRVSAVPTFVSRAVGPLDVNDQTNVFNLLAAVSAAITRTINVQAEVVPRTKGSTGVGWIAAVEKTLLRHRFSFTVGNLHGITTDQYVLWQPVQYEGIPSQLESPKNVYFGFNIVRLWKLK
jgi:hypothetical protein